MPRTKIKLGKSPLPPGTSSPALRRGETDKPRRKEQSPSPLVLPAEFSKEDIHAKIRTDKNTIVTYDEEDENSEMAEDELESEPTEEVEPSEEDIRSSLPTSYPRSKQRSI